MELSDYINIFNKEFAGKLLFNHLRDYIIKIDDKDPLYRPLYNLFVRELEVLHQYLDKVLEKRWIKPFTSLIGVSILLMLKKDGSLWLYIDY